METEEKREAPPPACDSAQRLTLAYAWDLVGVKDVIRSIMPNKRRRGKSLKKYQV